MKTICTVTFSLVTALFINGANATENGVTNYPQGAPGAYLSTFPPLPGLFVLNQTSYTFADGLYGNDGKRMPGSFRLSAAVDTIRILASYNVEIFGAHLYQQVVIPAGHVYSSNASPIPFASFKGESSGTSNITFSPFILSWVNGNGQFSAGLDVATPLGSYESTQPVSLATGYASFLPVVAYHYSIDNGIDFSIGERTLFNLRNGTTKYQSGTTLAFDFSAGYNFGNIQLGAVGGYQVQVSADKTPGFVNFGRFEALNVGPSIRYNAGPISVNLNYQQGVYARNTSKASTVWLNIAVPLQIAGPPYGRPPVSARP